MTPANDSIDLVDRLVAEYADRLARDDDPRREELLAQAPQFRAELERCFRMLEGAEPGPGALAEGLELGDFRLGRVLGRGGMAVVYEAEQKSLGRRVALKVLRHHLTLDEKHLERFQREARAAAKLAHENVVAIHAVGATDGHATIAFELVPGPTLARVIDTLAAAGARPTPAVLARASGMAALAQAASYAAACVKLFSGVLAAMEFAHGRGVIHRDLKPSNVLLTAAGKPLVADFGLAKDLGEASLSLTGETIGTPHYMAPEQANALGHAVDARTDVYALGVMLYELLTLRRPFEGRTFQELVQRIVTVTPRSPCELAEDLPAPLGDVVLKAMAKEPARRYASVAELREDLERALCGTPVRAPASRGLGALYGGWFEAQARGLPYEYRSKRTLFGLPWIHVVTGVRNPETLQPKWAKGVVAVGDYALGLYAAGKFALGFVALGWFSFGMVAIGALALGHQATGGIAFGWTARGLMVAGYGGTGLLEEWVARREPSPRIEDLSQHGGPSMALLACLASIAVSLTVVHGIWSRTWPSPEHQRFLRWITRFWMPLAFAIPYALYRGGIELPVMGIVLCMGATSLAFGQLVKRKLGPSRSAR